MSQMSLLLHLLTSWLPGNSYPCQHLGINTSRGTRLASVSLPSFLLPFLPSLPLFLPSSSLNSTLFPPTFSDSPLLPLITVDFFSLFLCYQQYHYRNKRDSCALDHSILKDQPPASSPCQAEQRSLITEPRTEKPCYRTGTESICDSRGSERYSL